MKTLFLVLLLAVTPFVVGAHEIKSDNGVQVLLHSEPNDDPFAGAPATLFLTFSDASPDFKTDLCNCFVYVAPHSQLSDIETKGDKFEVGKSPMENLYGMSYSIPYFFPKRGIYAVVVEGSPRAGATFSPFRIQFDLRISHESMGMMQASNESPLYSKMNAYRSTLLFTVLAASLLLVGILIRRQIFNKK